MDSVQLAVSKSPGLLRHSMLATDRLGGIQAAEIPLAMAFGDRDLFQSEGAA